MHEASLVENIIALAEASLESYQVAHVNSLTVHVGKLANVMEGALHFAFEALSEESICRGAKLHLVFEPISCSCRCCNKLFSTEQIPAVCPVCRNGDVEITGGTEIFLSDIDFDEED